jgi:hypothetical protein
MDIDKKEFDVTYDFDRLNYDLAIQRIKNIVIGNINKNLKLEDGSILLFSYDDADKCPIAGYFIKSLFDGPTDDRSFFVKNGFPLIKNILSDIVKSNNLSVSIKKEHGRINYLAK